MNRAELIEKRNKDFDDNYEEFLEMMDDIRDIASYNASFMPQNYKENEECM